MLRRPLSEGMGWCQVKPKRRAEQLDLCLYSNSSAWSIVPRATLLIYHTKRAHGDHALGGGTITAAPQRVNINCHLVSNPLTSLGVRRIERCTIIETKVNFL
jgi:hypothetical protein